MECLTAERPDRDPVSRLSLEGNVTPEPQHQIRVANQHHRPVMRKGRKRMHGGERVIEPAFKEAETNDQRRANPRQAFLEIRVVLTGQRQLRQVIRQRSGGIHVANDQVRPPADLQQRIRPAIGRDQRP